MTIARIVCPWGNWPGSPGVSVFYGDAATMQPLVTGLKTFFDQFSTFVPSGLSISVPNSGDLLDEATGTITGAWSLPTAPNPTTMTGTGVYAGNAGMVVHWLTTTVLDGRRARGRTFIVPLVSGAYDSQGSLTTTAVGAAQSAATALVTAASGSLTVWHRPKFQKPKTTPPTIIRQGSKAVVTSAKVPDLAVSLRSRRA